jgi:hypothetical protein
MIKRANASGAKTVPAKESAVTTTAVQRSIDAQPAIARRVRTFDGIAHGRVAGKQPPNDILM